MEDDDPTSISKRLKSSSPAATPFSNKIKFHSQNLQLPSSLANFHHHHLSALAQVNAISPGGFLPQHSPSGVSTPSLSSASDSASPVKNGWTSVDLELKNDQTGSTSACITDKFSGETNSFHGDIDEADSSPAVGMAEQKIRLSAMKIPSQAEIDEFFAESEREQRKRFEEKYNFDVVKDMPLEGRYEWVLLKPEQKN